MGTDRNDRKLALDSVHAATSRLRSISTTWPLRLEWNSTLSAMHHMVQGSAMYRIVHGCTTHDRASGRAIFRSASEGSDEVNRHG